MRKNQTKIGVKTGDTHRQLTEIKISGLKGKGHVCPAMPCFSCGHMNTVNTSAPDVLFMCLI